MSKAKKAQTRMLPALALMALPTLAIAQGYYDDDIYYNPSKETPKPVQTTKTNTKATTYYSDPLDYPAADTYIVNTGSTRDVDEYNRHGQFLVPDSVKTETTTTTDTYANTRKIQRFHNEGIVDGMSNDDYATYVITNPAQLNIYVESPLYTSFYNPLYSPFGYYGYRSPYWSLSWGYYDPWFYDPWYGPSWGFGPSWGWGPSWGFGPAWGPGWGPSWGFGPTWGPGWNPGPGWGPAPKPTPSGSSRPHAYAGTGNSIRPVASQSANKVTTGSATGNRRPGNGGYGNSTTTRPGTMTNANGSAARPGTSTQGTSGTGNRLPSNHAQGIQTQTRPQNTQSQGTQVNTNRGNRNSGSSTHSNSSNRNSNSSNYNTGSSNRSSSHSSSYSTGGGSRSSGGFTGGGGSSRSSGGGSRGGRR